MRKYLFGIRLAAEATIITAVVILSVSAVLRVGDYILALLSKGVF